MSQPNASAHRAWALREREQTDRILHLFLVDRLTESEAPLWLKGTKSYPQLPEAPEVPASTRPPGQ